MESRSKEAKCFSFEEISPFNLYSLPVSITVSGIHRAVVEDDLEFVKYLVEAGESVNVEEQDCRVTPLYLGVITDSAGIIDYLLSRHDIEVDASCSKWDTPLQTACYVGAYETVKKLIDAGADVNLPNDKNVSPLHMSVPHPNVCHLLLQNGANVDAVDEDGVTPILFSARFEAYEVMHMLLYYNADPNIPNKEGMTLFMHAIVFDIVEDQETLLNYVVDFNAIHCSRSCRTILGLALQYGSPFAKDIIERGADVNYGDQLDWRNHGCAFMDCLHCLKDESVIKVVWERLRCYRNRRAVDLCALFDISNWSCLPGVIQVIIESDNLELAVDSFSRNQNFCLFVHNFILSGLEMKQLVALTYRLLEYGYRPTLEDVHTIFSEYGPCELRRVLLYMDIDCGDIYRPEINTYLRAMLDLDFDAAVLADKIDSGECQLTSNELISVLEYFRVPYLVNVLQLKFNDDKSVNYILNSLSKVPSLVELARNQARKHIRERFRVANACQFYTILDRLDILSVYKSVITYSRKIYRVKQ